MLDLEYLSVVRRSGITSRSSAIQNTRDILRNNPCDFHLHRRPRLRNILKPNIIGIIVVMLPLVDTNVFVR